MGGAINGAEVSAAVVDGALGLRHGRLAQRGLRQVLEARGAPAPERLAAPGDEVKIDGGAAAAAATAAA